MIDHLKAKKSSKLLSFVVIGGMSFHGAKIANYLHNMNFSVTIIEDAVNIEPDPIKWYIGNLVTTDVRDVVFYNDPFKAMAEIGDYYIQVMIFHMFNTLEDFNG